MMTAKQYIAVVLLAGLVPAFVLFALNILVDPYNELGVRLIPQPLVETSRSEKISLLRRLGTSPELMIFGSSQAMELDPGRFSVSAFNMAVNSALPEDILAQVLWLEANGSLPGKALLLVDFYVFNETVPTDARLMSARFLYRYIADLPEARSLRRDDSRNEIITPFWGKYFSRKLAADSWKAIRINLNNGERVVGFNANGLLVRVRDLETRQASGWSFDVQKKLASYTQEKYSEYRELAPARVHLFERVVSELRRNGVEMAVVLSPFHPALQSYLQNDAELANRLAEVRELLAGMARENSYYFLDYSDISSFNCRPEEMWDLIHLMPECADRLLDNVIGVTGW